jgi:formate dehydrogenase maturation protein FdhE
MIKTMEKECCPNCGKCENIHANLDLSQEHRPVEEYLCNECGTYFKPKDRHYTHKD